MLSKCMSLGRTVVSDPFLATLVRRGVPDADVAALSSNYRGFVDVGSQSDIIADEASSNQLHILLKGWACKYRLMADGRRQILQIHLPGEVCDVDKICNDHLSFGVFALTDCRVATIPLDWIRKAADERQALRDLLWSLLQSEYATMTEHVVSLGRRSARERTAYVFCDLLHRLRALNEGLDGSFRLPLTQVDIGDYLGLSTVHINRTLQDLKGERLIQNGGRTYTVIDVEGLERVAGYARYRQYGQNAPLKKCA